MTNFDSINYKLFDWWKTIFNTKSEDNKELLDWFKSNISYENGKIKVGK